MPAERRLYVVGSGRARGQSPMEDDEMKVHELIEILQDMDPEAEVFLGVQPTYPFEHAVPGVVQRGDWAEEDDTKEPWTDRDRWGASDGQLPTNDVLILDGGQVRYGAKAAWEAARRW